jgi:aldose 1-epimerase
LEAVFFVVRLTEYYAGLSKYHTAVVYAPGGEGRDFICFEPMSGITNAFNLAHRGRYDDLQSIAPGAEWVESYSIHPSGF